MEVKKHDFVKKKNDREFLLDCVLFSEADRKVVTGQAFTYNFHGLFLLNTGSAKISLGQNTTAVTANTILFLRAHEVRQWISVTPDFSGFLLIFENEFVQSFFQDRLFIYRFPFFHHHQPNILPCCDDFFAEQIRSCQRISAELATLRDDSHHYIRSLIYNMFISISRQYKVQFPNIDSKNMDDVILRFMEALDNNIREKQLVEEYAELLQISRNKLNKIIRQSSGKTPSALIKERLITEIKGELLYANKHIAEIAYEMGFSDTSNFVRFYKTYTGVTPGAYRAQHAK